MKPRHTWTRTCQPARRHGSPGLDSGCLFGWPLVREPHCPLSVPLPPLAQTWHSKIRLETNTENEACSTLLARLLVTPTPAKPRKPREKSHPSLQCAQLLQDWVADGAGWSYPVFAGIHE